MATSALERLLNVSLANFLSFSPSLVSEAWSGEAARSELQSSIKSKLIYVFNSDSGITLTTKWLFLFKVSIESPSLAA